MTTTERDRWDRRYAEGEYRPRSHHSPFLERWVADIPAGRALDIACGAGRNALYLARSGFEVTAVDVSTVAIDMARSEAERRGLDVTWQVADLDDAELGTCWDLITVVRYRNLDLWPRLVGALAPNGWLLVDHHLVTDAEVGGPPSDDFRVRPGELLNAFRDLRIIHYAEGLEPADDRAGRFAVARVVACNGHPGF